MRHAVSAVCCTVRCCIAFVVKRQIIIGILRWQRAKTCGSFGGCSSDSNCTFNLHQAFLFDEAIASARDFPEMWKYIIMQRLFPRPLPCAWGSSIHVAICPPIEYDNKTVQSYGSTTHGGKGLYTIRLKKPVTASFFSLPPYRVYAQFYDKFCGCMGVGGVLIQLSGCLMIAILTF